MRQDDKPQVCLITPAEFEIHQFSETLKTVLDEHCIACVRLSMATQDEMRLSKSADVLREICHAHDVALVIDSHIVMVERLGLDGVHLDDGARSVRKARKELGPDAIVGSFCGASQHDGMNAGESGADYVAFGPITGDLGDGSRAETDLFQWWSEMIEVPVIAQGGLTPQTVATLSPITDFFAFREEIWHSDNPNNTLKDLINSM